MKRPAPKEDAATTPGLVTRLTPAAGPAGNASTTHKFSKSSMATVYELYLEHDDQSYAAQAAAACFAILEEIEQELSRFISSSDISGIAKLRRGEKMVLGQHAFACLTTAQKVTQASGGAFDIAYLSSDEEAGAGRSSLGEPLFVLDGRTMVIRSRKDHLILDLGGIGKGYALDCMADTLREWELDEALLQGGHSSLLALAPPDHSDGWELTISHPDKNAGQLAGITLKNLAMGASGVLKGPHIKVPGGFEAAPPVTVRAAWSLGDSAAEMDALSTAAMLVSEQTLIDCCRQFNCSIVRLITGPAQDGEVSGDRLLYYGARQILFVPV